MKSCLVICAPKLNDASFVRPLKNSAFFHDSLNAPEHGVQLLHPVSAASPSFPVWIEKTGDGIELVVPDRSLQNTFQSPGRNEGLLFLNEGPNEDLRLSYGSGQYHYGQLVAASYGLPLSLFFDSRTVGIRRQLLREQRHPSESLSHWGVGVGTPNRPPDGWMNPILLRLEVAGTACERPHGVAASDTRMVMQDLLRNSSILGLVPAFDQAADIRAVAWALLLQDKGTGLADKGTGAPSGPGGFAARGPLTAVERLVVGGVSTESARAQPLKHVWPFLALDGMGGRFLVQGHGNGKGALPPMRFSWHPPEHLAPNGRWLAGQFLRKWERGDELTRGSALIPSPPTQALDCRCEFSIGTAMEAQEAVKPGSVPEPLELPRRTFPELEGTLAHEQLDKLLSSTREFMHFFSTEATRQGLQSLTMGYFRDLFDDLESKGIPLPERLQLRWMQRLHGNRLACDVPGFLDEVARQLVTPMSPVLARLPDHVSSGNVSSPADKPESYYLDLVRSVPAGGRAMVWGVLRATEERQHRKSVKRTMGWWNDWHVSLFSDAADVHLEFLTTGFVLGKATLGDGVLGESGGGTADTPTIRFSVPL